MWDDGRREEAMGTGSREERQVRGEGKTDPAWFCSAKTSPATGYWCGKERSCVLPAGRLRAAAASLQNSLHCTFREVPAPHSTVPTLSTLSTLWAIQPIAQSSRPTRKVETFLLWRPFWLCGSACTRATLALAPGLGNLHTQASPALSTSQTPLGWSMSTKLEPASLSGELQINTHPHL